MLRAERSLDDRVVCVLGLGYVGLTLAVAMADSGFRVHGLEVRNDVVDRINAGRPHFWEPRLKEKLGRVLASGAFTVSRSPQPSFAATVYIITVGTPLRDGRAYLDSVRAAADEVASVMPDGALVILRSTVKLGTARTVVRPILDASGKRFELAVCPERTLEGKALIELHELPQVIGADTASTRSRCAQMFGAMTHTTVALSSLEAAELTKLVDNTYRDIMFGFSNEIARLCGHAGLSAIEIIRAGKLGYARTNVALPGPVGGPCLEKDPHILAESARAWGVDMPMTAAARQVNEDQPRYVAAQLAHRFRQMGGRDHDMTIAVAGLAFKGIPATDDLRGTMAKPIVEALASAFPGARFRLFDPLVEKADAEAYFGHECCADFGEATRSASLVVIANNHLFFQNIDVGAVSETMASPGIIFDFWNQHDDLVSLINGGIQYISLGSENFNPRAPGQALAPAAADA